jgi:hypothetical protein
MSNSHLDVGIIITKIGDDTFERSGYFQNCSFSTAESVMNNPEWGSQGSMRCSNQEGVREPYAKC